MGTYETTQASSGSIITRFMQQPEDALSYKPKFSKLMHNKMYSSQDGELIFRSSEFKGQGAIWT